MRAALFLVVPALVSFALIQLGFRILYDSVIPEVAGLVIAGAAFALGLAGLLRLAAFPTGGAVVGLISSFMFRQS